jgi:hypothetical protein
VGATAGDGAAAEEQRALIRVRRERRRQQRREDAGAGGTPDIRFGRSCVCAWYEGRVCVWVVVRVRGLMLGLVRVVVMGWCWGW